MSISEEPSIAAIEALAEYAHTAWSGWMNYLFQKSVVNDDKSVTIPPELARRWWRQMMTLYNELPENEKESDREEARRMLRVLAHADGQQPESESPS